MNSGFIHSIDELDNIVGLTPTEREEMENVTEKFPFRANEYYLSLIDWKDRQDPLRRIVVPDPRELKGGGCMDPSRERDYTRLPGLQHKYDQTGLLLLTDVCGGICRFCFRKRLFLKCERETIRDVSAGLEYIKAHREITNVLLTGGDPFTLETHRLGAILKELREIEHVNIIRIGSKMLAYNPYRFLTDPGLIDVLSRYSTPEKRIYIMAHFNHPREMTEVSMQAVEKLHRAGIVVVNQTPVLNEVNSDPRIFTQLFRTLSFVGVSPYYVFQCRPSLGNLLFQTPVEHSYDIIQQAWLACSGLAKRARFVMSHATGKIEVVGKTAHHVVMRYHQAADSANIGRTMIFRSNPMARWFDDYRHHATPLVSHLPVRIPKMKWMF
ncbi:MAG: L-lysine 2,3-aminomutase [Methanoregulaceae archaeon PtaU1.Bin222]|nr:MAG: L-lysine 2,3-aminomutase [Methanoregulaceae archaeon PtaU1.Bin222]